MIITVLSCNKNEDTFAPFHHCMEKYFPNHPEVVYFTDGIINPFYKTIPVEHDLEHWTTGLRELLKQIDDEQILLMIDDCFIRKPVDEKRIQEASKNLKGNIACFNFEKSWDEMDKPTDLNGWKIRTHGRDYEVSLMCGLWNKQKLLDVIKRDCDPWTIELFQDGCGYDYYINSGDYIIDWGYETFVVFGKTRGRWTDEAIRFLESEGFYVGVKG